MHRLQSAALLASLVLLFAFIGYTLFGLTGLFVILVGSTLFNIVGLRGSARLILSMHRARWLSHHEAPDMHHLAAQFAHRANIPVPKLAIFPSDMPNAFALGTHGGIIAFSTGLLNLLDRREVAGVMAHEFAHLKNNDSTLSLSAGLFTQAIASISSLFTILLILLFVTGQMSPALLPIAILVSVAPNVAYLLQTALSRTREYLADRDGALLSGDPKALASALYKLEQYNRYLSRLQRRFRFIYTTDAQTGPKWLRTHPPTEDRIAELLKLSERTRAYPMRTENTPRYIAVQ